MHIFAESFDYKTANIYSILADVLAYSAKINCPSAKFELLKTKPPNTTGHDRACTSNTVKLNEWVKVIERTKDNVILMDCDMLICGDLEHVFKDHDFDIALCKRTINVQKRIPYNGGVIFVRDTPAALDFMKLWEKVNLQMYNDKVFHNRWRKKYAGMNQAAFGYIYEKEKFEAKIKFLPCSIYNACRENWKSIDKNTKIIHIKSQLRTSIVNRHPIHETQKAYTKWYAIAETSGADLNFRKMKAVYKPTGVKSKKNKRKDLVFRYESYADYLKKQIEASKAKQGPVWAKKDKISYLCNSYIKRLNNSVKRGICHGARKGDEITWFRSALKGCEVIGTDIIANDNQENKVVKHDFNMGNLKWKNFFDFIYSNCLNHSPDPKKTILAWVDQINDKGFIVIEYSDKIETQADDISCYAFSFADIINGVKEWTRGEYQVTKTIKLPMNKKTSKSNKTSFLIIERMAKSGK